MIHIKDILDKQGSYQHIYKSSGYNCYLLDFIKVGDKYCVYEHLSTEDGREEDIGIEYETKSFVDLITFLQENTNYFGEPFFDEKGELIDEY